MNILPKADFTNPNKYNAYDFYHSLERFLMPPNWYLSGVVTRKENDANRSYVRTAVSEMYALGFFIPRDCRILRMEFIGKVLAAPGFYTGEV
jgi:hypothetical protein